MQTYCIFIHLGVYPSCPADGHKNDEKSGMKIKESIVMAKMRIVIYSGGSIFSIIVPWLGSENYDRDVVRVAGDVGQGEELSPSHEKAKKWR